MQPPSTAPACFKRCSSCKKEVTWNEKYWICSVSSCNRQRTGLAFCSVACFDAHLPILNHKSAGAVEQRAPTLKQFLASPPVEVTHKVRETSAAHAPASSRPRASGENLIVASRLKGHIAARSGMQTSERVMDILSDKIRTWLDDAIRRAAQDGRKTVLDRDLSRGP